MEKEAIFSFLRGYIDCIHSIFSMTLFAISYDGGALELRRAELAQ